MEKLQFVAFKDVFNGNIFVSLEEKLVGQHLGF